MKLTSVKVRYQDADIEQDLSDCAEHFKLGIYQFSSYISPNHIELRENKNSTFMESFYQRLSKILVCNSSSTFDFFRKILYEICKGVIKGRLLSLVSFIILVL